MSNKQRRGGLGRGLGALIPTAPPAADAGRTDVSEAEPGLPDSNKQPAQASTAAPDAAPDAAADAAAEGHETPATAEDFAPVPGAEFALLPVGDIRANVKQPRQVFDDDALDELTHSIREFGVLQPVVVRRDTAHSSYELVMGERRLRAATAAGLDVIPAIVRSTADDAMLRDALLENIHRAQLNPLEEAAAYHQLLGEFGTTHEELAQRIGRSRPQISNTIRLLNLPVAVQRRVAAGVLSAGHARALLALEDAEAQDELAARIVAEGLSVRATEELVTLARAGGTTKTPRKPATRSLVAPGAADLADRLADVFDTRVRVDIGRRKGRISVEFASIDDLERIVALMAPGISTRATAPDTTGQPSGSAGPNVS
ncbi:ParB/RepB/Spo0J family partition protein [uncultured Jatrophihabitans sp.]|uniref:ParB/RepB/Spo0J family partition protein n=1 Tax=uncultured Jatrophihabitans sp. TaxID=1610747 RepID=UPI0035CA0512